MYLVSDTILNLACVANAKGKAKGGRDEIKTEEEDWGREKGKEHLHRNGAVLQLYSPIIYSQLLLRRSVLCFLYRSTVSEEQELR